MRVQLPAALRAAVLAASRTAYPRECCGLLEGRQSDENWRVAALHAARNLSDDPHCFQIDPGDHIAAQKAARSNGNAIIGCYHSHPDGRAEPSSADLAGAGEDNFLWLISGGETVNAFVYLRGAFVRLDWGTDCVTSSE